MYNTQYPHRVITFILYAYMHTSEMLVLIAKRPLQICVVILQQLTCVKGCHTILNVTLFILLSRKTRLQNAKFTKQLCQLYFATMLHCNSSVCATIHQVTTMLATSENALFPGHN